MALLEVEAISKAFGGRTVVDRVSFSVGAGKLTCLLGPSGCGKSTTLRIIQGVERADSGSVRVAGREVEGAQFVPPEARATGMMFQDYALFPHLSVEANVGFGLKGRPDKAARVAAMLEQVGLSRYARAYPHELSGGEQQRVALARALAPEPSVMLMDEPFSGLDDRLRDGVRDETLALLKAAGTAVVMVTHEPEEAMRMADEIALMRDGRIVQIAPPAEMYRAPVDRRAAAFFSDVNVVPGRVSGGSVDTPFGRFESAGLAEGQGAEVVIRPQHVRLDFDHAGSAPAPDAEFGGWAQAQVRRARFTGKESIVELDCAAVGGDLTATVPDMFLPDPGTPLWAGLPRARAMVFAA
ncbi:MAG: Fe3+/spermidine/putrescine ABC transporter ATP-binding protein [Rhodobacterales bacterium]|nr:MAG: Fe3+/spermidine/putrescine ABC transporter ATP-binding protein [Rhodobacterales bacterium]